MGDMVVSVCSLFQWATDLSSLKARQLVQIWRKEVGNLICIAETFGELSRVTLAGAAMLVLAISIVNYCFCRTA